MKNLIYIISTKVFLCLVFLFFLNDLNSQTIDNEYLKKNIDIEDLMLIDWESTNALPFKKGLSANRSFEAFATMENDQIAFLSNVEGAIMIFNNKTGAFIDKFNLEDRVINFTYANRTFYVLSENGVKVFDQNGNLTKIKSLNIPSNNGVIDLEVINDEIFIIDASGVSYSMNKPSKALKGWAVQDGSFAESILLENNKYLLRWYDQNQELGFEKIIDTEPNLACAIIIGADENYIYTECQNIVNDSPMEIERYLHAIERNQSDKSKSRQIIRTKLPEVHFTYIQKDMEVGLDGIHQIISSPMGVHLFKLRPEKESLSKFYPNYISDMKIHYNQHLLQLPEDK